MSKKQYRNVYTIMDKVKKGEITTTSSSSRFSMDFKKRAEVIKPYIHYIDNRSLTKSVDYYLTNSNNYKEMTAIAERSNKKLVSPATLPQEVMKIWKDFPKEVVADIYNLMYHKVERLEFEDRGPHNKFRFQFLEKANNPVTKVITQESNLKSMVFTRHMMQYFLMLMAMMQQEDAQKFQNMMDQLKQQPPSGGGDPNGQDKNQQPGDQGQDDQNDQGQNGNDPGQPGQNPNQQGQDPGKQGQDPGNNDAGNNPDPNDQNSSSSSGKGAGKDQQNIQKQLEKLLNQMMNNSAGQKMMDQAINEAKKTTEMIDQVMSQEEQDDLWDDLQDGYGDDFNKTDKNKLTEMEKQLRSLKMNLTGLREKLKNLLDKSASYFQGREVTSYETLFDTDSLDGLQDYDMLHPCLRNLMLDDIMLKDVKRQGKIDIFIDISGSMNGSCGVNGLNKLMFAKALALKMKEMDMLNEVYTFNEGVKKRGDHLYEILGISCSGGTNLNTVVQAIERHKRNAIVLTDAEDYCRLHSDMAYFIGVAGADFTHFEDTCLKKYTDRKQLVVFDGNKVLKVNEYGKTIR